MPDWTNRLPSAHPGLQKKSRAEAEVLCSLRRSRVQITTFLISCMLDRNSRQCLTWLLLIPVHFEGSCPFWVTRGYVVSAASTVPFIIQVTASGSLRTASFHVRIFLCVLWRLFLARPFQWLIWGCTVSYFRLWTLLFDGPVVNQCRWNWNQEFQPNSLIHFWIIL